jgi:hypothetical protein
MKALVRLALLSIGSATVLLLGGAGTAGAELRDGAEVNVVDEPGPIQGGVCGNAVAVLGDADASCEGSQDGRATTGNDGDGDNEEALIAADVGGVPSVQGTICGNAVGALGDADASCEGSQDARTAARDDGDGEAAIDIDALRWAMAVQIDACGNAVAALGDAHASCAGSQAARAAAGSGGGEATIVADVGGAPSAQGTICGNAVGIGGDASATCDGSQGAGGGTGLQMIACGNAVGALGEATASCEGSRDTRAPVRSDGDEAIVREPSAQAVVCGNAVGIGGDAAAACEGPQDAAPRGVDPVDGGTEVLPGTGVLPASGVLAAGPPPADLGGLAVTGVPHGLVSAAILLFVLGASVLWASRRHREEGGQR